MTRQDVTWVLDLIKNRDARTDAERDAINMAIDALQDRPTGTWIIKYDAHSDIPIREYYCDQCGKRGGLGTMLFDDKPLPNFCGHCGADMRAKSDNERSE